MSAAGRLTIRWSGPAPPAAQRDRLAETMVRIPRPRVRKAAAIAAGIGGGAGLLYSIADCALRAGSFRDFISVAAILGPFGAFLGWWAWLFWLALKADRFMRYLAVAAFLALAVLIFALQRPNLRLAQRFQ